MVQKQTPLEIFNKHASAYQERFMHFDLYDDTYDKLCQVLKPNASVLEIGCGPGNITAYLLSKRPDLDICGIDLAENMIELAKANCPGAKFAVMDGRDISSLNEKFDAVVCGFCLPYLNKEEVEKLITDSSQLLNGKGILYLSAIEDKYEKSGLEVSSNGQDACYIYYYEESALKTFFELNHFENPIAFRKIYSKSDNATSTHLILIACKK